ncbi:hypothetical protein NIES2135_26950 [Leptolyngbya boryana NIES-2135]|jgi:hypothetical protein|uniref:Uncharacterized protein n=1 Tax=Leptolyngbya boryana NIES-2135 TaxID=1973484 RepID=A0A1Z4JGM4_LEPBY|nr:MULTISPECIES: hypothetical protein [Leptolyngbya]BAY55870.1 hypothetical protein NIES2135_26950 [Leptolyngbya boryana NIES-2135]MBD2368824.1 hypothetical protein [Leptolyngbya sp. FACHB-161]MBD2375308.1 hypothetical protein [Leptolyngbya sp. FACHB-238]MBD2399726.1 hypothetical protein [Leptolyngbya sp. FACHB-239]MBD2405932.1 hypothetical protein [Leptolyngbya sp. FACHB-402]
MTKTSLQEESMPPRQNEPKRQFTLRIEESDAQRLEAYAQRKGIDMTEALRRAVVDGIPELLRKESIEMEFENRLLVNKKLKLSIERLENGEAPD